MFCLFSIAYQKIDQDIIKKGPQSYKNGLAHLEGVYFKLWPLFSKSVFLYQGTDFK